MKRLYAFCSLIFSLSASFAQTIVYVDNSAIGNNTGTSWQNAYADLADAVQSAPLNAEIWVAKGISSYKVAKTSNRADKITIGKNLKLYGGFAGTETDKSQRKDLSSFISGDIGLSGNTADNSYNAFLIQAEVLFDGFTFRFFHSKADNLAYYGVLVADAKSHVTLHNVTFTENEGNYNGVCLSAFAGSVTEALNVNIQSNNPLGNGSLFARNDDAVLRFTNCQFVGNGGSGSNAGYGNVFYAMKDNAPSQARNETMLLTVEKSRFVGNTMPINFSYFGSCRFKSSEFLLEPSSYPFNCFGDSASLYFDSCDFTGNYKTYFIYASALKNFEFKRCVLNNTTNSEADFFYVSNCKRVVFEDSKLMGLRGSNGLYIYSPNGNVWFSRVNMTDANCSSYPLYIVAKNFYCKASSFLRVKSSLGGYFTADSAVFVNTQFEETGGVYPFLATDYIKNVFIDSCDFSKLSHTYRLFTVSGGNTFHMQRSRIKSLSIATYNPGTQLIMGNWEGKVTLINNRFEQLFAYGRIFDNTGEMNMFGNVFEIITNKDALIQNSGTLSIYNCNFGHLSVPLFLNDTTYNSTTPIKFTLANSVIYNDSDTMVLNRVKQGLYVQDISNCYSNRPLPGSSNTLANISYAGLYAGTTFAGLQDKGRNVSSLPQFPSKDVLGNPRIKFSAIDIGAIEFQDMLTALDGASSGDNTWKCYPNPTKDLLWLETEEPATLELFDLKGAKILTESIPSGKSSLSLESLENGMYVLSLQAGGKSQRWKVMKR